MIRYLDITIETPKNYTGVLSDDVKKLLLKHIQLIDESKDPVVLGELRGSGKNELENGVTLTWHHIKI